MIDRMRGVGYVEGYSVGAVMSRDDVLVSTVVMEIVSGAVVLGASVRGG